jgi:hypothetical protein
LRIAIFAPTQMLSLSAGTKLLTNLKEELELVT